MPCVTHHTHVWLASPPTILVRSALVASARLRKMVVREQTSLGANGELTSRQVHVGGVDGAELLAKLKLAGVQLNELGLALLASRAFAVIDVRRVVLAVELSVSDLGLSQGATIDNVYAMAKKLGLHLCPIDLGPHLRLEYLDQPEVSVGPFTERHRAPPGAVTIASPWSEQGDDVAKGFYLRCVNGTLWLRGYCCDAEHVWDAGDRFVFCSA